MFLKGFGLFFWATYLLAIQKLNAAGALPGDNSKVKEVRILQEYYDTINNNNFTVVKYYTHWCSHCKKLKPIFERMSNDYTHLDISDLLPTLYFNRTFTDLPKFFETDVVNIDYLSIECDIFGAFEICKRWPGYPVVELVAPNTDTTISIDTSSEIEKNNNEEEEMPTWLRIFTKIDNFFNSLFSGKGDLDDMGFTERALEFQGSRTEPNLKTFIQSGVISDYERLLIDYLLSNKVTENTKSEFLIFFNDWIKNLGNKFVAVTKIIDILKADFELKELDADVKRDLMFQKRLLTTLINIEEQERIQKQKLDEL